MKKLLNTGPNKTAGGVILLLLLFWQWGVNFFKIPPYILPSPGQIIKAMGKALPLLWPHIGMTVFEALLGFLAAVILALVLAFLMDSITWVKNALYPLAIISQTIPIISIAPLFILWFGYGIFPKMVVVALVCFFPLLINLIDGLAGVDEEMIGLFKTMGASRWQIYQMVKLPGTLPSLFCGLKIAATYSIMGAVIGEWLGAAKGIGVFMIRVQKSFQLDMVFVAILVICIISMLVVGAVKMLERISMPWKYLDKKLNQEGN